MEKIIGPSHAECYRIVHESGAEATIALHGGHVISWKTADGVERLYLSPDAEYSNGKAIRGGIPVIFPQFNEYGPYSRHGFARKLDWTLEGAVINLKSSDETFSEWPHAFEISIGVELTANSLETELSVRNPGDEMFSFQAALHTYLRVQDIDRCRVWGLKDIHYKDEVTGRNCWTMTKLFLLDQK